MKGLCVIAIHLSKLSNKNFFPKTPIDIKVIAFHEKENGLPLKSH